MNSNRFFDLKLYPQIFLRSNIKAEDCQLMSLTPLPSPKGSNDKQPGGRCDETGRD